MAYNWFGNIGLNELLKKIKAKFDTKSDIGHKHTKSDITNFPESMPASDVKAWAKADNKPTYTASEIGLGNVGNYKAVSTVSSQGLTDTEKINARTNIGAGTSNFDGNYNSLSNKPNIPSLTGYATQTWVQQQGYKTTDNNTTYSLTQDATDGHKITLTPSSGNPQTITIPDNNTWRGIQNNLISDSTTDSLSAAQGKELKRLVDSKTSNTGTVTSVAVKMNNTVKGTVTTNGTIDLGTVLTSHQDISGKLDKSGGTMTGQLKWSGVTSLPESSNPSYMVTIDSFAQGGTTKWASLANVTVGNANKVNNHTVNKDVPSNAVFTDTNTWRPLGTGANDACAGNDSRLSNSRPASDVYSWAKASSKPTYTANEVGALPSNGGTHVGTIQAVVDTGKSIISTINNDNLKSGTGLVMNANAGIDYGGHELANKNDINGRLSTGGGALSGMLTTSFGGIAPCTKSVPEGNLQSICNHLRFSNGCMGSVYLTTDYECISASWYTFLWIPHRHGGNNGAADGDNCDYGTLLLFGMTDNDRVFHVKYQGGGINVNLLCPLQKSMNGKRKLIINGLKNNKIPIQIIGSFANAPFMALVGYSFCVILGNSNITYSYSNNNSTCTLQTNSDNWSDISITNVYSGITYSIQ